MVVAVGYNDFENSYAGEIETALADLKAAGVTHVWWLTLRAARHPYLTMNDDIEAAAQKHPELTVVDWNVYSRSHPDWFQSDGLHLLGPGSEAMATLIHQALLDAHVAAPPPHITTAALPAAHRAEAVPREARGRPAAPRRTASRSSTGRRSASICSRAASSRVERGPGSARTPCGFR